MSFPFNPLTMAKRRSYLCETDLLVYGGSEVLCGAAMDTKTPTASVVLDLLAYDTPGTIENIFISSSRQFFAVTWTPAIRMDNSSSITHERRCRAWVIRSRKPFELGQELVWLQHISHSIVLGFSGDLLVAMTKTQRIMLINLEEESMIFYRLPEVR